MSEQSIRNCFAHTGLFSKEVEARLCSTCPSNKQNVIEELTKAIMLLHVSDSVQKLDADAYLAMEDELVTVDREDIDD
ncbi:hypothetical protein HK096_001131 [Nowakowskiella sp. JEL0078]|nr:hypothetical protein HK096_001131 [Nowakowskiella sp. JEL0078]